MLGWSNRAEHDKAKYQQMKALADHETNWFDYALKAFASLLILLIFGFCGVGSIWFEIEALFIEGSEDPVMSIVGLCGGLFFVAVGIALLWVIWAPRFRPSPPNSEEDC